MSLCFKPYIKYMAFTWQESKVKTKKQDFIVTFLPFQWIILHILETIIQ